MLCSELIPGCIFGRMSGQRSRMNLGMGDEACFGSQQGAPGKAWPVHREKTTGTPYSNHRHGWCTANFPLFLGTPPEVVPAPLGKPSLGSPGPVRVPDCWPSCQPVPSALLAFPGAAHLIIRSQSGAGTHTSRLTRGWLAGTYPLLLQLSPPTPQSDIFKAFHPSATRCTHVCCTHPHRNLPTTVSSCPFQPPPTAPLSCQY